MPLDYEEESVVAKGKERIYSSNKMPLGAGRAGQVVLMKSSSYLEDAMESTVVAGTVVTPLISSPVVQITHCWTSNLLAPPWLKPAP